MTKNSLTEPDSSIQSILHGDEDAVRSYLNAHRDKIKGRLIERFKAVLEMSDIDAIVADVGQVARAVNSSRKSFDTKRMSFDDWILTHIYRAAYSRVFNRIDRRILRWVAECADQGDPGPSIAFFEIVMGRTVGRLCKYFAGVLSREDICEAISDAIHKVFLARNRLDDTKGFQAWFLDIARKEAISTIRRIHGDWVGPYTEQIALAAASNDPVLIFTKANHDLGLDTCIAKMIHKGSRGKDKPFRHVAGTTTLDPAFLKEAAGGTLFIEECADIPHASQSLLLQVATRETPGSNDASRPPMDVRILAATQHDLDAMAQDGHFLPELCDKLKSIVIRLEPPRPRPGPLSPGDDKEGPTDSVDSPEPLQTRALRECIEELPEKCRLIIEHDIEAPRTGSRLDDGELASHIGLKGGAASVQSRRNEAHRKLAICIPTHLVAMGMPSDSPWVRALRECLAELAYLERSIAKADEEAARSRMRLRAKEIAERLALSSKEFEKIRNRLAVTLPACITSRLTKSGLSLGGFRPMSLANEFWAEMVKYLPPRDLFEEITPEEAQAMLDVGEDATLTEEEISRFSAALRAGQAEWRAAQANLPDEETPPNITRSVLDARIIILVAHPIAMRKLHKGSRGAPEVRANLVTGDTTRHGGPESWKLTTKDRDPDIPLPPEVASRCYGTPSQSVTLTLHLVPVASATGRFGPQLAVSPAPTLDALIFDVTFPDGTEQTLTVPVPRGKRPTAHSQSYNPLPDTALGQGKWELTVSPR